MPAARRNWTRSETLVAFNLYCRTPFGRLHHHNPDMVNVAGRLGRSVNALVMKCCNLAAFDQSLQFRGVAGLTNTSKLDKQIWNEFAADPETIAFEAEQAFADVMHQPARTSDEVNWEDVAGLDREAVTKVRVNQSFFRSLILTGYESRCAICRLPIPELLVASHIIPWSLDTSLRMNPRNGLCLCALHDKAFDTGLIWIAADYAIAVSERIEAHRDSPAVATSFLLHAGQPITLPTRWHPDPELLQRHRDLIATR